MYNQGRFYFKIPIYSLSAAAGCAESWLQVKGVSSSLPCSHLAWVPFKARCSWKIRVLGLGSEYRGAFSPKEGRWSLLVALGTSVEGGGVQRAGMMWWRSRWGWKIGANDGDYWGGFTFISCGQGTKVRCGTCRDEFALTKAIFFFPIIGFGTKMFHLRELWRLRCFLLGPGFREGSLLWVFPGIGVLCVPLIPRCWWPWFPSCWGTAIGIALLLFLNYLCFSSPSKKISVSH